MKLILELKDYIEFLKSIKVATRVNITFQSRATLVVIFNEKYLSNLIH